MLENRTVSNVRVGKAQTRPTSPAHTPGVKEGNARGNFQREKGIADAPRGALPDGARATARRSTSINPEHHGPIDPRMPNLTPA